ncbi:MAG: hypothetical protein ACYS1A_18875 [Planctomycetota bacterium]
MRARFRGNIKRSRLPKESRTLPIYGDPIRGDGLDAGIYYRCWHCGFLCNSDRDALGDSQSRSGVRHNDYAQQPDPGYDYAQNEAGISKKNKTAVLGDAVMAAKNDSDDAPKFVGNAIMVSERLSGCPFCGCKNWRGDY